VDLRQQVLETRATVDGWVLRARSAEEPQPGAELQVDDRVWPARRVSETARLALIGASEHLQMACQVVDGPRGYATALHTVLRGALLGAATAVWLLGPSEADERQQRGLRLAAKWYWRKAQYDEYCRPHCPPEELPILNDQIQHSKAQESKVKALWEATPTFNAGESPTDTKVMKWVADFMFANDEARSASVMRYWSELSGDAHALGWQLVSRRTSPLVREPGGFRLTSTEGAISHIADPYLAGFTVLRRGWSLFDQRCSGP
jgi:hypothetical protein